MSPQVGTIPPTFGNGEDTQPFIVPPVPKSLPADLVEYERAKARAQHATHVAVMQLRDQQEQAYQNLGERTQELHGTVAILRREQAEMRVELSGTVSGVQAMQADMAAVRVSVGEMAESMGTFMGEFYAADVGQDEDLERLTKSQDAVRRQIGQAMVHAQKARAEATEARASAEISALRAKAAEELALKARQLRRWQIGVLLGLGPVLWKLFEALYQAVH